MHLIGYRYILIKESQAVLDRIVFIHNGAFLNYTNNKDEKKEALEELENIVKLLGTTLEKYKKYEITTDEMDNTYISYREIYKKVIIQYPWLSKFDLHSGCALNYSKYFKKMK